MPPEDVVIRQVDAYNAHELEAFVACYADDVVVMSGTGQVMLDGSDALREQYGQWFPDMPDLHADVLGRVTHGSWVVDEERAAAPSLGFEMGGLIAYRIRGDVIDRVVMMAAEDASGG
jgi:hypothetical protein